MESAIRAVLSSKKIPAGNYFDSHYVIQTLLKDKRWTAQYMRYVAGNTRNSSSVAHAHSLISKIIKRQGDIVERAAGKSVSHDIHGCSVSCALWRKR